MIKQKAFLSFIFTSLIIFICFAYYQVTLLVEYNGQIEIVDFAIRAARNSRPLENLVPQNTIEMSNEVGSFLTILDDKYKLMYTAGTYKGEKITPPANMVSKSLKERDHKFIWSPDQDTKIACVARGYNDIQPAVFMVGCKNIADYIAITLRFLIVSIAFTTIINLLIWKYLDKFFYTKHIS